MRIVFTVFLLCMMVSCNRKSEKTIGQPALNRETSPTLKFDHVNTIYDSISVFKYFVFRSCLKSGYNNSENINAILKEEVVLADFPFGITTLKYIDSLALKVHSDIIADSLYLKKTWLVPNSDFQDVDGKRVIAHCLDYFISAELDSIANAITDN